MSRVGRLQRRGLAAFCLALGVVVSVGACSSGNGGGRTPKQDAAPGDGAAGATGDGATTDAPPGDGSGEAGPVSCGAATCQPADFHGLATLPACCTQDTTCGLDLGPAQRFVAAPDGCVAKDNPGIADSTCPSYDAPSLGQLSGCCRSDHTCGVFVQLSSTLDLGCVPAAGFADEAGGPAPCGGDAGYDADIDAHTVPGDAGSDVQTSSDGSAGG